MGSTVEWDIPAGAMRVEGFELEEGGTKRGAGTCTTGKLAR